LAVMAAVSEGAAEIEGNAGTWRRIAPEGSGVWLEALGVGRTGPLPMGPERLKGAEGPEGTGKDGPPVGRVARIWSIRE
jgi:hypothetical protein